MLAEVNSRRSGDGGSLHGTHRKCQTRAEPIHKPGDALRRETDNGHLRSVISLTELTYHPAVPENSVPVHPDETGSFPDTLAVFQMLYDTFDCLGGELRSEQRCSFRSNAVSAVPPKLPRQQIKEIVRNDGAIAFFQGTGSVRARSEPSLAELHDLDLDTHVIGNLESHSLRGIRRRFQQNTSGR